MHTSFNTNRYNFLNAELKFGLCHHTYKDIKASRSFIFVFAFPLFVFCIVQKARKTLYNCDIDYLISPVLEMCALSPGHTDILTVLIGKRRLNIKYYLDLLRVLWPISKTWLHCTQIFPWPLPLSSTQKYILVIFSDILAWIINALLKWHKGCQINI